MTQWGLLGPISHALHTQALTDSGLPAVTSKIFAADWPAPYRLLTCCAAAENFNWCTVPDVGYDVIFVPGVAVILACLLQNRLSTTWVLVIGAPIHADTGCAGTEALHDRRPDSKAKTAGNLV